MKNLTVAVLGSPDFCRDIGKKGTSSDITFYNLKKGQTTVTLIEPSRYPERVASLFFSVSLADEVILVVDEVNALLGETVIMLDTVGIRKGVIIPRNYLTPEQLAPVFKGTVCETYSFSGGDPAALREELLKEAEAAGQTGGDVKGIVPVDHFFPVKGIGTVILGCVERGSIRRHDTLSVIPLGKTVQIRSIQEHDDEVEVAFTGDRVGLALKGIEPSEIDRGFVLSSNTLIKTALSISSTAVLGRFWQSPLREGMVLSIGHWMQFLPCRIARVSGPDQRNPEVTLQLEKDLVYVPGDRAVLHYLEGGKLRVIGSVILS